MHPLTQALIGITAVVWFLIGLSLIIVFFVAHVPPCPKDAPVERSFIGTTYCQVRQ